MDKNLKKIKYQELFLSELRNSYFGEKKLEESLREMETKENMKKLAKALKNMWKQTDEDVKSLEKAFPKVEIPDNPVEIKKSEVEKIDTKAAIRPEKTEVKKKDFQPKNLKTLKILTYDNLVELVDTLNNEQITEILESAAEGDEKNFRYLTSLAEKLVKERDAKA